MRRAVTDADKQVRREQLLAAAREVFAAEGYHEASIAEVARRAGSSYGLVYTYFDSKEDLFHALMEAEAVALRAAIAEAVRSTSLQSVDALRVAIEAVLEFFEADPSGAALLFRDPPAEGGSFARHLGRINEQFVDDLAAAIEASQGRGHLRRDLDARDAATMIALLVGQLALRRVGGDAHPPQVTADQVVSLVMEGLLPR